MENLQVHPVGKIFNKNGETYISLYNDYIPALQALDGFSHLNIIWWFSDFDNDDNRAIVQMTKPYKKGPSVMGTFATRSPIRPNPLALTNVQVINIDYQLGIIKIPYIDANDGSPVLDIKPYTPSLDRIETPYVPDWCNHWPMSLEQPAHFNWEKEFNFKI